LARRLPSTSTLRALRSPWTSGGTAEWRKRMPRAVSTRSGTATCTVDMPGESAQQAFNSFSSSCASFRMRGPCPGGVGLLPARSVIGLYASDESQSDETARISRGNCNLSIHGSCALPRTPAPAWRCESGRTGSLPSLPPLSFFLSLSLSLSLSISFSLSLSLLYRYIYIIPPSPPPRARGRVGVIGTWRLGGELEHLPSFLP
jgi:hypothetical protein